MDTEKTFSIEQLIEFVIGEKHTFSLIDAIRFFTDFLKSIGEEVSETEINTLVETWKERNGYTI